MKTLHINKPSIANRSNPTCDAQMYLDLPTICSQKPLDNFIESGLAIENVRVGSLVEGQVDISADASIPMNHLHDCHPVPGLEECSQKESVAINPLPNTRRKAGYLYTKVKRLGRTAVYELADSRTVKYYEVFQVKIKPESLFKGKLRQAHESFPGNEDFGKAAWSCRTLNDAMARFNLLIEEKGGETP